MSRFRVQDTMKKLLEYCISIPADGNSTHSFLSRLQESFNQFHHLSMETSSELPFLGDCYEERVQELLDEPDASSIALGWSWLQEVEDSEAEGSLGKRPRWPSYLGFEDKSAMVYITDLPLQVEFDGSFQRMENAQWVFVRMAIGCRS
jgi:hypothetical protein